MLCESVRERGRIEPDDDARADDGDRHSSIPQREQIVVGRVVFVNHADVKAVAAL